MKAWVKGIIAGAVIAAIGVIVLIVGLYLNGWKFPDANYNFEMRTFTAENENTELVLRIYAGAISTEYTDGDRIIVEYPYAENYQTTVTENEGKLTYSHPEHHFKISFSSCTTRIPHTTIKLPRGIAYDLDIKLTAGTVTLADGEFGKLSIKMSAGTISTEAIKCETFDCDMSAGTVSVKEIEAEKLACDMSAGTVSLKKVTSSNTSLEVSAGTISAKFTGEKSEYNINVKKSAGSCNVATASGSTDKTITVKISAGTVSVNFL